MAKQYDISEYESKWLDNPKKYSIISVPMAADYIGGTQSYVFQLGDKGKIDIIKIQSKTGKRRAVRFESLLSFKSSENQGDEDRPNQLLQILELSAQKKQLLTYGEAMEQVGLTYRNPHHRTKFSNILYNITFSSRLYEHDLLVTALLVYKSSKIPNPNFFDIARNEEVWDPDDESPDEFFKRHINEIFEFFEAEADG